MKTTCMGLLKIKYKRMNKFMKKIVVILFILLLVALGSCGNEPLRGGLYKAVGEDFYVFVSPNKTLVKNGKKWDLVEKNGYYSFHTYEDVLGHGDLKDVWPTYSEYGPIQGKQFNTTVAQGAVFPGGWVIQSGTAIEYKIINSKTFTDPLGQKWVWVRSKLY